MLVKFFKTGGTPKGQIGRSGGGNSARDYLLFEKDENGNKVPRKGATLFRGDADMTTETINGLENRTVYSSGVISFSEREHPDDDLLNKLIDSYEETLFPTLNKDQYSSYWVKHEDKGRIELHFVIANVELYSGKVLPVYYDKNDRGLVDSWQNYNNDLYGLDNPKAPENKRSRKITKDFEVKDGYQTKDSKITDEELKGQIYDRIFAYAEFMPSVKSRDDVIKAFEQFDYKVVSKPTDKYISIEHPEQKNKPDKKLRNLRFKDDLCLLNFNRDMLKDMKSYKQQKWERDTPNRLAQSKIDLDRNLEYRIKRMEKKFKNIERKPLDNQLTKDLTQIRASNEPEFLKQVAEWQRAELKKIIGQTIEQIYKRHEHDQPEQLASLKNLHQILIDDIDSRIQDEPLTQFDEVIANYQNSKNHIVTVDQIEYDRHQAELLAQQAEQARLAQLEQQRQDRLALLASFDKFTLDETGIDELESMDYQALLDLQNQYQEWLQSVDDYAQHSDIEPYLNNYQYYRATLNYLHDSNLIEQKRIESERPIDPLITQRNELDELKHGYVSKISLYTYQTASNAVLEKIKQDMLDRIKLLDDKAEHELLTDKEKSSYGNAHRVINTIDDILSKREPEPFIEPEIVRSDDKEVAQPTPDHDLEPTPEPPPSLAPQSTIEEKRRWSGRVLLYQNIQKIKKDFSVALQVKATADNMPDDKLLDPTDKAFDVMLDNGITLRDDINRIADEFNANKEKLAQQATRTTEPVKSGGLDR